MEPTFFARQLAFGLVRMAAPKHGEDRYRRALRFAERSRRRSRRRHGPSTPTWDQVIELLREEV